jgi:hypothetical protein
MCSVNNDKLVHLQGADPGEGGMFSPSFENRLLEAARATTEQQDNFKSKLSICRGLPA